MKTHSLNNDNGPNRDDPTVEKDAQDNLPESRLEEAGEISYSASTGYNEGLGCIAALFFGVSFVVAVNLGSLVAAVIFGIITLLFVVSLGLTIIRRFRERRSENASDNDD